MRIEIAQVFTQIVSFLVMYWVLKRFAWKPLLKIMEDRRNKIAKDFADIEEEKKNNEAVLKSYQDKLKASDDEASAIVKKAQEKALALSKEIENEAREEAKSIISHAQDELQHEIVKAKEQLKQELVDMTILATKKVVEEDVNPKKQDKILKDFVSQVRES